MTDTEFRLMAAAASIGLSKTTKSFCTTSLFCSGREHLHPQPRRLQLFQSLVSRLLNCVGNGEQPNRLPINSQEHHRVTLQVPPPEPPGLVWPLSIPLKRSLPIKTSARPRFR